MWHSELLPQLKQAQPRWRWRVSLNSRGGTLSGRTQKAAIDADVTYRRGRWDIQVYRTMGLRRRADSVLMVDETYRSLDELIKAIVGQC